MKTNYHFFVITFIVVLTAFIAPAHAQLYVGGGPSMMLFGQETIGYGTSYGLGAKIRYTGDSEYGISGTASYFFPHESTNEVGVPLKSSGMSDDFTGTGKTSMLHLGLHVNYFFGDPVEDVSLYGVAGVGYLSQKASFKLDDCDPALYDCEVFNFTKTYSGTALDVGLGINVGLDNISIFAEGKYSFPWNEAFATDKPDNIEAGVGAMAGVIIPITD
jgi:hypothetical protein